MRAEIRFIIVGSLTVINILCASPARDPKRAINGQTVDLTPLIEWWQHHAGKRPFPGWVHATGQIVGTNTCGWTVEGSVDTPSAKSKDGNQLTSGSKFILKTPPVQELAEFTRLDARLKELKAERDQLNREIKSDNQRERKLKEQRPRLTRRGLRRAGNTNGQLRQTKADERDAQDRLDEVEKEIKQAEKRRDQLSSGNHYTVDCFALKLNLQFREVPIYDHGAVLK